MTTWRAAITVPKAQVPIFEPVLSEGALSVSSFEIKGQEDWLIDALFDEAGIERELVSRLAIAAKLAAVKSPALAFDALPDKDWVTLSLDGLEPVRAGRFFIHGAHHADRVPTDAIAIEIEAGPAFGTGQHETTTGCLLSLEALSEEQIQCPLDLGTGTGVLAIAMANLWPCPILASDIDPVSVSAAKDNARKNGVGDRIDCRHGDGLAGLDGAFDLIAANILAQPLIQMSADICARLRPSGHLILSGLLKKQKADVMSAFCERGLLPVDQVTLGDWPTLRWRKP